MAVVGFDLKQRTPLAGGMAFGTAGAYERILGTLRLAVDPDHPRNAGIVDLKLAPRGADGRVHFDTDVEIMRPVEPARGALLYDVVNRGRKLALRYFNFGTQQFDAPLDGEPDLGTGFLMAQGYTLAWSGWQRDIPSEPGLLALRVPDALQDGAPVRGRVIAELEPEQPANVLLISDRGHRPYPTLDLADPTAALLVRSYAGGPPETIARDQWQFARVEGGRVVPDANYVYLSTGFVPGKRYDVVYTTEGAPVVGLGLVATRDFVTWLRHGDAASGNPCAGTIRHTLGFGSSQSGRFLRHFLSLSLNEDEDERIVFDGMIPYIAGARRGEFNYRFAQPSKLTVQMAGTTFPFTDVEQTDPVTGQTGGLLTGLLARGKEPKVIYLSSGTEYWGGAHGSLVHTSIDGARDIDIPATSRIYYMAGTQHGSGTLPPATATTAGAKAEYALNSVDQSILARAALVNLARWVTEGDPAPPSQYPRLDEGTAVPPEQVLEFFRTLPGGRVPAHVPHLQRLDFGPRAAEGILDPVPATPGADLPVFISAVNEDGNEVSGVRQPDLTIPLGTYTGWNVRHRESPVAGEFLPLSGATIPFARTIAEREATGDPRSSVEERYASKDDYLRRVRHAADDLAAERYLLAEDVERVVERAALRWDLLMAAPEPAVAAR